MGVDNSNAPIIGWNQGTHPDIGIGRYKMNPPNAGITFFNDGLPDQNILDIGKSPPLFGAAWIFCITESGPFVCTGVAVGLDQISTVDQNIEVYPNPTNDILNIQVPIAIKGNSNVIFYDCSGNVVLDKKMSGFRSIIDISLLPSGLYIIKVLDVSGKLIGAEKIIKH